MIIDVEFLHSDGDETIAKVTVRPSWFARVFLGRREWHRFARTVIGTWVWDDTGEGIWTVTGPGERIERELAAAFYWRFEHPRRVAFAEAHRRVDADGRLRSR